MLGMCTKIFPQIYSEGVSPTTATFLFRLEEPVVQIDPELV